MDKLSSIRKIISEKKADALLLTDIHPCHEWLLGKKIENSFVIVKKSGKPVLVKTVLESFKSKNYKIINVEKRRQLKDEMKKLNLKKLCVDFRKFTLAQKKNFRGSKLIDVSEELGKTREVKDGKELSKLRKANQLTAECFNKMIKKWKTFKHESDAVRFIKQFGIENGCGMAFDPLIASGVNAATPHHRISTKLNKGFCVIDFGMDYAGYKADMTRTVYLGKPSKQEKELYDEMLRIQNELLELCLPGTKTGDIDAAARTMLGSKAELFTHSLGHGTGLEIHESPNLSPKAESILKAGMVVTVEPGIYDEKKRYGIRIEDSILIRSGKPEILTKKAKKELIILNSPR